MPEKLRGVSSKRKLGLPLSAALVAVVPALAGTVPAPAKRMAALQAAGAASAQSAPAPFAIESRLLTDKGQSLQPSAVAFVGNDVYVLDTGHIWWAPQAVPSLYQGRPLLFHNCGPASPQVGNIPVQEFSNFAADTARQSLVVLDKTGDVFEMTTRDKHWQVLRPNAPMGSPDPEYIDIALSGKNVLMLDPERNQIWRYPATSRRYFKDVLPWRATAHDISVANGIGIAYDGSAWVLRANGAISRFRADPDNGMATQLPFSWRRPAGIRPSRLFTASATAPLYVVERENNRVLAVDKNSGAFRQYLFPQGSDLRGLWAQTDGFWILNGDRLQHRLLKDADRPSAAAAPRQLDARLAGLVVPLKGAHLPRHPGVWAGARRLYRFGVHHGTDFFNDPGNRTAIAMDTPVFAADSGKVVRADNNFKDMNGSKYSSVIYQCTHNHICSESNEDLLRGCQVWIDHGNGLVTRYAHLDKIRPGLKPGMKVTTGDLVGFVGVSGTGENLPGRAKHPHLHFEVWLDGKYVGFGLTPAETIGVYEDIFGSVPKS